ncbi:MAG: hypothetical protein RL660_3120 [Bacteroidota bacterium]|jgi:hypothetical protein
MNNKINIDDLFREALHEGQEVMPSTSWSNMSKMLDGENPYTDDGSSKKPYAWLFGLLLAGLVTVTGAYLWLNSGKKEAPANQNMAMQQSAPTPVSEVAAPNATNTSDNAATPSANTENATTITSSNNENDATESSVAPSSEANNADNNYTSTPNNTSSVQQKSRTNASNTAKANRSKRVNTSSATPVVVDAVQDNSSDISNPTKEVIDANTNNTNSSATKVASTAAVSKEQNQVLTATPNTAKKSNAKGKKQPQQNDANYANRTGVNKAATEESQIASSNTEAPVAKKASSAQEKENTQTNKAEASSTEPKYDTYVLRSKSAIENDTIAKIAKAVTSKAEPSTNSNSTEQSTATAAKSSNQESAASDVATSSTKSNKKGDRKTRATANSNEDVASNKTQTKSTETTPAKQSTQKPATNGTAAPSQAKPSVAKTEKKQKTANEKVSDRLQQGIEDMKRKGHIQFGTMRIKIDPAVLAGLNRQLQTNKSDLGGFHAGMGFAIKLSKHMELVPHAMFYYKNNGGYSIRDTTTNIISRSGPVSYNNSDIYSYTNNMTTVSHNFKRVLSAEAPIVLKYNVTPRIGLFGGANLAYGFRYNTQDFYKTTTLTVADTVAAGSTYNYPTNKTSTYQSPDFNARFGVGYIAGAQWQATSQLLVDFRVAQNLWDNSTTPSAKLISNNTFYVPSMQLSIGYRIKDHSDQ